MRRFTQGSPCSWPLQPCVALLLGALAEAIGLRGGDVTLYAGLAMLLASAVMLALLLVPARRR